MDKEKWYQLWQIIEKLSQNEDELSLIKETVRLLTQAFPRTEIQHYKLNYNRSSQHNKKNPVVVTVKNILKPKASEEPLQKYADLTDCVEHKKPLVIECAEKVATTYIYPLYSDKGVRFLFKAKIPGILDHTEPVIKIFFNTLFNFYKSIRANERDFLTGLYNRRAFDRIMNSLEMPGEIQDEWIQDYLIIVDIDFFKKINDNYGHMIGDEVLILFSRILLDNIRTQDTIFRTGGEEFVILARQLTLRNAFHTCERLRNIIANTLFPQVSHLTISMGFAKIDYPVDTYYVLKKADRALYYAKDHGRNQVFSYEWLVHQNKIPEVTHISEIIDIW